VLSERENAVCISQLSTLNSQLFYTFFPPSPSGICRTIGFGKSYPVTAAQLLPISTGFLAPIHFLKLTKNWSHNYSLALGDSSTNPVPRVSHSCHPFDSLRSLRAGSQYGGCAAVNWMQLPALSDNRMGHVAAPMSA
jgi:hypothetical protein